MASQGKRQLFRAGGTTGKIVHAVGGGDRDMQGVRRGLGREQTGLQECSGQRLGWRSDGE